MSITVRSPLTVRSLRSDEYAVSGSPVDCVNLALGGLIEEPIDIVISGINNGANLCDDVFYSGTVAAVMEGRSLKTTNIAVSIPELCPKHYETAVHVVSELLGRIDTLPNKNEIAFLNVNVPDVPVSELLGIKATTLGKRLVSKPHKTEISPKGVMQCWIGKVGDYDISAQVGTEDYQCLHDGFASVTPIKAEWVHEKFRSECEAWLSEAE